MKILVIDNYDSFTYNLVTMLRDNAVDVDIEVRRNDQITIEEVDGYDKILISPGPSVPNEAGITKQLIQTYAATKSILGICLGHQAIAEVFGAEIYNMPEVYHGHKTQLILQSTTSPIFKGVVANAVVGLYHSWSVDASSISEELEVTATNTEGHVMAIRHNTHDVTGLQFHPESILTENGSQYIKNWLNSSSH
jgi:anthranilate synthase component 2